MGRTVIPGRAQHEPGIQGAAKLLPDGFRVLASRAPECRLWRHVVTYDSRRFRQLLPPLLSFKFRLFAALKIGRRLGVRTS
jgi:hypothetical protein